MTDQSIVVLGIPIPSSSPLFLGIVAVHVGAGLAAIAAGIIAMLAHKRSGLHPNAGTLYYWSLVVVCLSMAVLSVLRWPADNHLLALGVLSLIAGIVGRRSRRRQPSGSLRVHVTGMGLSYILLLTAFYVDNGPNLPFWRLLPPIALWLIPGALGLPVLVWALARHPLLVR